MTSADELVAGTSMAVPAATAAVAAASASRSRRAHLFLPASGLPSLCCVVLLLSLLVLAPSSLFPSNPAGREAAERSAATMEELGPMMQATTVIRWGVMFANAGGSCPYNAPGTTSCSSSNAPAPGCNPITSCRSPQSVTECVLYCGARGRADGGKACLYVPGAPCQTCNGNTITNPMCCTGAPCPGPGCEMKTNPANGNKGTCGHVDSGSTCAIDCNSGYEVNGGRRICNSAGDWANSPTCKPAGCGGGTIPNTVAGGCKNANLDSGDYCNFNCADGYVLRDQGEIYGPVSRRRCWYGKMQGVQYCMEKRCGAHAPPQLQPTVDPVGNTVTGTGGRGTCVDVKSRDYCQMKCPNGYTITPAQPRCWFGDYSPDPVVTCKADPCPSPAPKDGNLGDCPNPIPSGRTCSHQCTNPGSYGTLHNFVLNQAGGVTGLHCFIGDLYRAGSWQAGNQWCDPLPCAITAPKNGNYGACLSNPTASQPLINSNQWCGQGCNAGYTRFGQDYSCYATVLTNYEPQTCWSDNANLQEFVLYQKGTNNVQGLVVNSFVPGNDVASTFNSFEVVSGATKFAAGTMNQINYEIDTVTLGAKVVYGRGYTPKVQYGGSDMYYQLAFGSWISLPDNAWTPTSVAQRTPQLAIPVIQETTPVRIKVVSEAARNGGPRNTKIYTIYLHRKSNDATLSALTLNPPGRSTRLQAQWYTPGFDSANVLANSILHPRETLSTTSTLRVERVSFDNQYASVVVTAVWGYSLATASYSISATTAGIPANTPIGTKLWTNGAIQTTVTPSLPLQVGENCFTHTQTSEDLGPSRKDYTYKIQIHRISNDPRMSNIYLLPPGYGLNTPFNPDFQGPYLLTVPESATLLTVVASQVYPLGSTWTGPSANSPAVYPSINQFTWTHMYSGATSQDYPLSVGDNWIGVKGLAEDFVTTVVYVFKVHRMSKEARLGSLSTQYGGTPLTFAPPFSKDVTDYYLRNAQAVPTSIPSLSFTATPVYPLATCLWQWNSLPAAGTPYTTYGVASSPAQALIMGDQTLTITCTSEDLSATKTYTVFIHKISNDATLASLDITPTGSGLSPNFAPLTPQYSFAIDLSSANMVFSSVTTSAYATQRYKIGTALWKTYSPNVWTETITGLPVGVTTVAIMVRAEDTSFTRIYQVEVTKQGNDARLKSLTSPSAVVTPAFQNETYSYRSVVRSSLASFQFTPTPISPAARIKYILNGGGNITIGNGMLSGLNTLGTGDNVFTIIVESEDRSQQRIYIWTIYRTSNDAQLASLSTVPVGGGLVQPFDSDSFFYRLRLPPHSGPLYLSSTPRHAMAIQSQCKGALARAIPATCVQYAFAPAQSSPTTLVEGGDFNVTVRVWAEERDSIQNYTIEVHTISDDSSLKSLKSTNNPTGLLPTFASPTFDYTIRVPAAVSSVTLTAIPTNVLSTVEFSIDNAAWTNSGANQALQMSGATVIRIRVTAESGATSIYTLTVVRASNSCDGESLETVPGGSGLVPIYATATNYYTVRVDPTVAAVSVLGKPANQYATQRLCKLPVCTPTFLVGDVSPTVALSYGDTNITWRVVSEDLLKTCDTTITVHRVSDSSLLASLASTVVSGFASNTLTYSATVSNSTDRTTFLPVPVSKWATMRWSQDGGATWLPIGYAQMTSTVWLQNGANNAIWFEVTSEDQNSVSIYKVNVNRLQVSSDLGALVFDPPGEGMVPDFSPSITVYSIVYASVQTAVSFQSQPTSATATQKYNFRTANWVTKATDLTFTPLAALLVGDNVLRISVTAGDGVTKTNYTITLHRMSPDTSLASLVTTPAGVSPSFVSASAVNAYYLYVTAGTSSVSITPTPSSALASMEYSLDGFDYVATPNGAALNGGALTVDSTQTTTFYIRVTAEETSRKRIYTVDVRVASDSTEVESLVPIPSGDGLAPFFDAATFSYSLVLPPQTASVQFVSTLSNQYAQQSFCAVTSPAVCSALVASGDASAAIATVIGGDVNVTLTVTAESGRVQKTVILVHVKSDDSALKGIVSPIGVVGPPFQPTTLDYVLNVPYGETNVPLFPTPSNPTSRIEYQVGSSDPFGLTYDPSVSMPADGSDVVVSIRVTAEDGSQTVYTVTLHWVSADARLTALAVSNSAAGLVPSFDSFLTSYTVQLRYAEDSGVVSWISSNNKSSVSVGVNAAADLAVKLPATSQTGLVNWNVGDNTVYVVNVAEDGATNVSYKIDLHRRSNDATLRSLSCVTTELSPLYDPATLAYNARVLSSNRAGGVQCEAVANHTLATVQYRVTAGATGAGAYSAVDSLSYTSGLTLALGNNFVEFLVTSEDGFAQVYSVTLYVASDDATLNSLTTNFDPSPAISPSFDRDVFEYSMTLENSQRLMTVTAVRNYPLATYDYTLHEIDGFNPTATASDLLPNSAFSASSQTTALSTYTLQEGDSFITIEVTSEDGSDTKVYKLSVHVKSSNSKLDIITCQSCGTDGQDNTGTGLPWVNGPGSSGSGNPDHVNITWGLYPPFDVNAAMQEYWLTVPSSVTDVPAYLYPSSPTSTMTYTLNGGAVSSPVAGLTPYDVHVPIGPLVYGANDFTLTVTSEDQSSSTTYIFHIYRLSPSNTLSALSVTPTPDSMQPALFDPAVNSYTFTMPSAVDQASIIVTPDEPTVAWVSLFANVGGWIPAVKQADGTWILPDLPLVTGSNSFTIEVEAEDGSTHSYTVTLYRLNSYCDIGSLTQSSVYALEPVASPFNASIHQYSLRLPNDVRTVQFSAGFREDDPFFSKGKFRVERVTAGAPVSLSGPIAILSATFSDPVTIVQPGVNVHFDITAEDYRVVCSYSVHVTRSPWQLTGWPTEMFVGETVPVTLVPDMDGLTPADFAPLNVNFALDLPTAVLNTSSVTINDLSPLLLQLSAPTLNEDATLTVTPSIGAPNPLLFAVPPQASINILKATWNVSALPDRLYPNQVIDIELRPNKSPLTIGLTFQILDVLTSTDAVPAGVFVSKQLNEKNATFLVKLRMPAVAGNYSIKWIASNFINPDVIPIRVLPPSQMLLTGITANDTDLTLFPRPTKLMLMYGRVARIAVWPMAAPIGGPLTVTITVPAGTTAEPSTLTWSEGNMTARNFYFSFSSSATRGAINFTLSDGDAPHFLPPPAIDVEQFSQCSAQPPPCVHAVECTDMPSPTYATSYTCVCEFGWSGQNCDESVHPPVPLDPVTSVIGPIAPINNINCDTILLDGSGSYGLGVSGNPNASYYWSLAAVNSSTGANLVVPGTLQTVALEGGVTFVFQHSVTNAVIRINATQYASYTGMSVLTLRVNQAVPAVYTFQLVVRGTYSSSPPSFAVLDTTKLPAPQNPYTPDPLLPKDWMPTLHMHLPTPIRRTVQNLFTLDLIPSACAPIPDPNTAMYYYQWLLTPIGPIGKPAPLASSPEYQSAMTQIRGAKLVTDLKNLRVPSSTLVAGWRYKIDANLTITTFNRLNPGRRLLASGAASSTTGMASISANFNVERSALVAAISGAFERTQEPSNKAIFDASPSTDPDDSTTPLSFSWQCFQGQTPASGSVAGLSACSPSFSGIPSYTQAQLVINSNALAGESYYQLIVQVSSPDGRTATTSARLVLTKPGWQTPFVTIKDLPLVGGHYWLSPNATLRLQASVLSLMVPPTPASQMDWRKWTVYSGEWNTDSQVNVNLLAPGVLNSPLKSSSLVMQPSALKVDTKYFAEVLVCEPTDPSDPDPPEICNKATTQFALAAPPSGGSCSLAPMFGEALSTIFTVTCQGWSDPLLQNPLTYLAKYRTPAPIGPGVLPAQGSLRTLTTASTVPRMEFILPAGEIPVEVHITNAYGATTVWTTTAYVAPPIMQPCEFATWLLKGYDSTLYTVLYSGDRDRTMQLLSQVTDMVLMAECPCLLPDTQFVQKQVVLSLAVSLGLFVSFDDLTVVPVPAHLDANLIQMAGPIMSGISACSSCANEEVWQMLAASVNITVASVPSASPYMDSVANNPWVQTFDGPLFFGQAQTTLNQMLGCTCDHLTQMKKLQKNLLLAISAATLPYELPMNIGVSASGVLSTVVVTQLDDAVNTGNSGVDVNLPSSSASSNNANYGTTVTPDNFNTAAGAGSTSQSAVTTTVTAYPPEWTTCRAGLLPPGTKLASDLFEIDFSMDGNDFNAGKMNFGIPVNDAVATMINTGDSGCEPWQRPVCAFIDETTGQFSSVGCAFTGMAYGPSTTLPDGSVVQGTPQARCQCNHTTEFAILLEETPTANSCGASMMGPWWYAIFMCLYGSIALVAAVQSYRIHRATKWAQWLPLSQHLLIIGVGVTRGFSMAMFWLLRNMLPLAAQAFVSSLPYLFYPWVFTLLIFAWAALVSASRSNTRLKVNPIMQYRMFLYAINALITITLLAVFIAMAGTAESDHARMQQLASAGNYLVGVVSFLFSVFLMYYGARLTWAAYFVAREAHRPLNPVAKRVLGYAFALFACFAGAALTLLVGEMSSELSKGDTSSIVYFSFDAMAYIIVLLMLRTAVNACLAKPTNMKYRARANKASWMNNDGEGDEFEESYDESSTSRSSSSSGSSRFGELNKPLRTTSSSQLGRFGSNAAGILDEANQAAGAEGPLVFEDGEVGAVGGGTWVMLEDDAIGPHDLVKEVEMLDKNGMSFQPALFKRFIKRQTAAQAEADARAAAAARANIGWTLYEDHSVPLGPLDEVKVMEVFDSEGKSFEPPMFKQFVKRAGNGGGDWQIFEDHSEPLLPGDQVREVEKLDENGQSFEPKQFQKFVKRGANAGGGEWQIFEDHSEPLRAGDQLKQVEKLDENGNSFSPKQYQTFVKRAPCGGGDWQIFEDHSTPLMPGDEVKEVEKLDENGQSFEPKQFQKYVKRAAPAPSSPRPGKTGWQLFEDHSTPLLPGDQVKAVELLDENGQSYQPALFQRMIKRAADASPVNSPRTLAKQQAKVGNGWQLFFDPSEQARPGDETVLVEQLDPNGASFNPACFKRVIKRKIASALQRKRSARSMLPPAVREPTVPAGKDHGWLMLEDHSEEAAKLPATEIISVEQFDANGLPYNPPVFKRFVRKPQPTLPPINFKGSTVLFHLNKMKAAGSVTATKPGELEGAVIPNTVNQPASPMLAAAPISEADLILPTPRSASQSPAESQSSPSLAPAVSPGARALLAAAVLAGPGLRDALVNQTYGQFTDAQGLPSMAGAEPSMLAEGEDDGDDDDSEGSYSGSYTGTEDDGDEFSQSHKPTVSVSRRASKHHLKRIVSATLEAAAAQAESVHAHASQASVVTASEHAVQSAMSKLTLEQVKHSAADAQRAAERDWVQNQLAQAAANEEEERRLAVLRRGSLLHSPSGAAMGSSPMADDDEFEVAASPKARPAAARRMMSGAGRGAASNAAAAFLKGVSSAASARSPSMASPSAASPSSPSFVPGSPLHLGAPALSPGEKPKSTMRQVSAAAAAAAALGSPAMKGRTGRK